MNKTKQFQTAALIFVTALVVVFSLSVAPARCGEIALSLDDAPWGMGAVFTGPQRTRIIIDKLDSLGIDEVVFYCVTERMDYHSGKERLLAYAQAGHLLANHSHSHPDISIGADRFLADIKKADSLLRPLPGFVPWFRYPYLHEGENRPLRDSVRTALAELGYRNGYVTVDSYDWYLDRLYRDAVRDGLEIDIDSLKRLYVSMLWNAIKFYDTIARESLGRSPKHVLLLHENDLAALFIDALVQRIHAEGWTIITPREAYRDSIAVTVPDVLINSQGRVVAIAAANGYRGPLRHPAENAAYLDSLFAEKVVRK
jgi:peptidoglycan/xylan/chitin deacetylase (PgdA/CDA1 family)